MNKAEPYNLDGFFDVGFIQGFPFLRSAFSQMKG
jgi:hypothetical protein